MSAREYVYVRKSWKSSEDGAIVVVNRSAVFLHVYNTTYTCDVYVLLPFTR